MKKLLVFTLVVGGLATMTSCKKEYTCKDSDGDIVTETAKIGKASATTLKLACETSGNTWSKK